jgi:hypothetical protein
MQITHYISKEKFDSLKSSKETLYPWLIEIIEEAGLGTLKIEDITNCKIYNTYTEIVLSEIDEETSANKIITFGFWF